jgi:hypothetical protein
LKEEPVRPNSKDIFKPAWNIGIPMGKPFVYCGSSTITGGEGMPNEYGPVGHGHTQRHGRRVAVAILMAPIQAFIEEINELDFAVGPFVELGCRSERIRHSKRPRGLICFHGQLRELVDQLPALRVLRTVPVPLA